MKIRNLMLALFGLVVLAGSVFRRRHAGYRHHHCWYTITIIIIG